MTAKRDLAKVILDFVEMNEDSGGKIFGKRNNTPVFNFPSKTHTKPTKKGGFFARKFKLD